MRKITHILLAILMTGICFSAVWMTQRHQNQIIVENKIRPADFTKLQQLTSDLENYNSEYEQLIERWSYLDEIVNG